MVDLASRLGVALHVRRWKGAEEGGTGGAGSGMQERARLWRRSEARDILDGIQEALSGGGEGGRRGCVATAHHGDDQAETVLLKALRGAHITKMQARKRVNLLVVVCCGCRESLLWKRRQREAPKPTPYFSGRLCTSS